MGWLVEKLAMLMHTFPHMTEEYVLDELDGAKGWALFYWARMNKASVWGLGKTIAGDGYVAQERKKIKNGKRR